MLEQIAVTCYSNFLFFMPCTSNIILHIYILCHPVNFCCFCIPAFLWFYWCIGHYKVLKVYFQLPFFFFVHANCPVPSVGSSNLLSSFLVPRICSFCTLLLKLNGFRLVDFTDLCFTWCFYVHAWNLTLEISEILIFFNDHSRVFLFGPLMSSTWWCQFDQATSLFSILFALLLPCLVLSFEVKKPKECHKMALKKVQNSEVVNVSGCAASWPPQGIRPGWPVQTNMLSASLQDFHP